MSAEPGEANRPSRLVAPDVQDRSLEQLWSLSGRRAVVTGGASGIGAAIAERLVEAGADVMVGDNNLDLATQFAGRLNAAPAHGQVGRVLARHVDVGIAASVEKLASGCSSELGGIDIWVNNAAIFPSGGLLDLDEDEWDRVIAVNLKGTWSGARVAARRMIARPQPAVQGVIVNLEAMAAYRGRVNGSHYVASKHGVVGLTRALASELGPKGIRVVGIAPTFTETPGVARRRAAASSAQQAQAPTVGFDSARPVELEGKLRSSAPLGRNAVADDVARAAVFCVSDMAALITGSTIFVDAGVMAP